MHLVLLSWVSIKKSCAPATTRHTHVFFRTRAHGHAEDCWRRSHHLSTLPFQIQPRDRIFHRKARASSSSSSPPHSPLLVPGLGLRFLSATTGRELRCQPFLRRATCAFAGDEHPTGGKCACPFPSLPVLPREIEHPNPLTHGILYSDLTMILPIKFDFISQQLYLGPIY